MLLRRRQSTWRRVPCAPNAQNPCGLRLGEAAIFDDAGDFKRQPGLDQFLVRICQAKIGKHIAAAFSHLVSRNCFVSGLAQALPSPVVTFDLIGYTVLTSASRSGCRSRTLSSFTNANGGLVFPFS